MSFELEGSDKLLLKLKLFKKEKRKVSRRIVKKIGSLHNKWAKKYTPVDTGKLRGKTGSKEGWLLTPVKKTGNKFEIISYNNVEYAPFQEEGFMHYKAKRFIPGKWMNRRAFYVVNEWKNTIARDEFGKMFRK